MATAVMAPLLVPTMPEVLHVQKKVERPRAATVSLGAPLDNHCDYECAAPIPRSKTSPGLGVPLGDDYPGFVVRNTFLEIPIEEPAFLDVRRVQSAPCTPVAREWAEPLNQRLMISLAELTVERAAKPSEPAPAMLWLASMIATPQVASLEVPEVASAEPQVGSPELPTVGSAGHHIGKCMPCAFMWKAPGCSNGVDCPFCHLCDGGEKKRRQREKKQALKALKQNEQ